MRVVNRYLSCKLQKEKVVWPICGKRVANRKSKRILKGSTWKGVSRGILGFGNTLCQLVIKNPL